ncbi:carboxymuconolactone decarboxylase family protein [Nocardioides sp. J54]|uniref:carboxymuconolactone decarboxylase family protein n=1 Tax=Nocardioides sp. J54 TaxID=935866 RepID=UPI001E36E1D3|nr:carboxymuconolactone decarboxylase family protein [Nocardioides sp. J54]
MSPGGGRGAEADLGRALVAVRAFSPRLAELTEEVLFGDVLARPGLAPRDRALATVSALVAGGNVDQLRFHGPRALACGVSRDELAELVLQLAFYAGWPRAMSALGVLAEVLPDALDDGT